MSDDEPQLTIFISSMIGPLWDERIITGDVKQLPAGGHLVLRAGGPSRQENRPAQLSILYSPTPIALSHDA